MSEPGSVFVRQASLDDVLHVIGRALSAARQELETLCLSIDMAEGKALREPGRIYFHIVELPLAKRRLALVKKQIRALEVALRDLTRAEASIMKLADLAPFPGYHTVLFKPVSVFDHMDADLTAERVAARRQESLKRALAKLKWSDR